MLQLSYLREKGGLPRLEICPDDMELVPCHGQYFKSGSDNIDTMQVKQEEEHIVPEVCRGCGLRKNIVAFNNSCGCCFCNTCTWKINAKKKFEGLAEDYCPKCKRHNY